MLTVPGRVYELSFTVHLDPSAADRARRSQGRGMRWERAEETDSHPSSIDSSFAAADCIGISR